MNEACSSWGTNLGWIQICFIFRFNKKLRKISVQNASAYRMPVTIVVYPHTSMITYINERFFFVQSTETHKFNHIWNGKKATFYQNISCVFIDIRVAPSTWAEAPFISVEISHLSTVIRLPLIVTLNRSPYLRVNDTSELYSFLSKKINDRKSTMSKKPTSDQNG